MDYYSAVLSLLDSSIEFEKLHSKFNRFNPFKILRVDQFEIRHSNVISWLLDPNGNHNLGPFLLNKLLAKIFVKTENEHIVSEYNLLMLHKGSLHDVEVFREVQTKSGKRIDILAVSEAQNIVILIENKYKSGESEGQLNNYLNFVRETYKGYTIIPIFLSLDGSVPSNREYFILDYNDILNILKAYIDINSEYIFQSVKEFLLHYIAVLEDELVRDEEDIALALDVYKKHRDAVDFLYWSNSEKTAGKTANRTILNMIASLGTEEKQAIQKIYKAHEETIHFIYVVGNSVIREAFLDFAAQNDMEESCYREHIRIPSFILPEWRQLDDALGTPQGEWWLNNAFVIWFERIWNDKIKLTVEVGPLAYEERLLLLNTLEENGVKIRLKSKEAGAMYTRIYTATEAVHNWADREELRRTMNNMYNSNEFKEIASAISKSIQDIVHGPDSEDETTSSDEDIAGVRDHAGILADAFHLFVKHHDIPEGCYRIHPKLPSFIIPKFRNLEEQFGVPRWNWWFNNCVSMWFERLKDDRLKFTIEVGPLEAQKRLDFLIKLEEKGIRISNQAKRPNAAYTKIYTDTCRVYDWSSHAEVLDAMNGLFHREECEGVVRVLLDVGDGELV